MPFSSVVRVCGCTYPTRNCLNSCVCSLSYVVFATAFAECAAVVEGSARSANILSPGVNVRVMRFNFFSRVCTVVKWHACARRLLIASLEREPSSPMTVL